MYISGKLKNELNSIKDNVKGLFKVGERYELVMNHNEELYTVTTIVFTQFGSVQENHNMPIQFGTLKMFPKNKSMNDMLNNPYNWKAFIDSFNS